MKYNNESFINMTLALSPNTILNGCIFDGCTIVIFDDTIETNNCKFINNTVILTERVL